MILIFALRAVASRITFYVLTIQKLFCFKTFIYQMTKIWGVTSPPPPPLQINYTHMCKISYMQSFGQCFVQLVHNQRKAKE